MGISLHRPVLTMVFTCRWAIVMAVLALSSQTVYAVSPPSMDDPCTWAAGEFRELPEMHSCFETIPYSAAVANETYESLLKALELYVFTDIASNPPIDGASIGFELQKVCVSINPLFYTLPLPISLPLSLPLPMPFALKL